MRKILFVLSILAVLMFAPLALDAQVYVHPLERGGPFYPGMYGGYPYGGGGRAANVIGAGVAGAAIGYMASGGSAKWAAIGGGSAAGVVGIAEYAMNRAARGPKPRDCSKKKPGDKKCEEALAEANRQAELAERQLRGGHLRNATPFTGVLTDCGERVGVLRPGQRVPSLEARCGFEMTMLVPSQTPGLREDRQAAVRVADDVGGWVFVAPRLPRQGGVR